MQSQRLKAAGSVLADDDHAHDKDEESINLRGAVLHVIGDLVQSIGVAMAGALIWWKQVCPALDVHSDVCQHMRQKHPAQ